MPQMSGSLPVATALFYTLRLLAAGLSVSTACAVSAAPIPAPAPMEKPPPWLGRKGTSRIQACSSPPACAPHTRSAGPLLKAACK